MVFLVDRPQVARMGKEVLQTLILNTAFHIQEKFLWEEVEPFLDQWGPDGESV